MSNTFFVETFFSETGVSGPFQTDYTPPTHFCLPPPPHPFLSPTRYGQLSGMVEPIAGLLGAGAVVLAEPLLPYALAFAAGAMVYVVVDDIIPEAQLR